MDQTQVLQLRNVFSAEMSSQNVFDYGYGV
jgi:hypothetical protein